VSFIHRPNQATEDDYDPTLGNVVDPADDDLPFEGGVEYLTQDELIHEGVASGSFWIDATATSLTRQPKTDDTVLWDGVAYTVRRAERHMLGPATSGWRILCQGFE
jgi:hypothetical protein